MVEVRCLKIKVSLWELAIQAITLSNSSISISQLYGKSTPILFEPTICSIISCNSGSTVFTGKRYLTFTS